MQSQIKVKMINQRQVAIIIPVYQAEKYLRRCVNSVLNQSFRNIEIELIDDGTWDDSASICDEYCKYDDRIIVIHQSNKGCATAYNIGLENVRGRCEYLSFVDDDDFVHPMFLEMLIQQIERQGDSVLSACYDKPVFSDAMPKSEKKPVEIYDVEDFYCEHTIDCIHPHGKLFPACDFDSLRFPKDIFAEDMWTIYKAVFCHSRVSYITEPLYGYFQSENSMMRSPWRTDKWDGVLGYEQQLDYFLQNGYLKAAIVCKQHYLHAMMNGIYEASKIRKVLPKGFIQYQIKYLVTIVHKFKGIMCAKDLLVVGTKLVMILLHIYRN